MGSTGKAALFQILAHGMQGHSAPTKTVEQKMMLGEEVSKPPGRSTT